MIYTNYQLLNTVPIAPENMMKFLTPSFEMYRNVQNDSTFLRYQINVLSDTTASALRKVSADNYRHKTVIDMMRMTPLFEYTDLYADTRYDVCRNYKRRMKKGKVLVTGNYQSQPVYGSQVNYPMQVVVIPTPLGVAGILRATPDG